VILFLEHQQWILQYLERFWIVTVMVLTNEDEKNGWYGPLSPCDYNPAMLPLDKAETNLTADCDGENWK